MAISTAVSLDRISRVVGYKLKAGSFGTITPNLPQRIALLGEANTANQAGVDENQPFPFINSKEVGDKYGYGSPLHIMSRILRPISGNILGGIETIIYPQLEAGGGTAGIYKLGVTVATTVTQNATHRVVVSGRDNIDGVSYAFTVSVGDSAADVRQAIVDAIANVLSSPVTAAENVNDVDFTTKWKGATAALNIRVDDGGKPAGIVYAESSNTAGTGEPSIANALVAFGNEWNTLVINPYGAVQFSALEAHNGVPDPDTPTGRYSSTNFKPYVALFGSLLSDKDDVIAITDAAARKDQVTNVLCPAPNSEGFAFEAAANMCGTCALIFNNTPHLGNGGRPYPDMPVPIDGNIGDFVDYNARDFMAKGGSSTVLLKAGKYNVQDFETTYHPDGEIPAKFRKVRDLNVNWNIAFGWNIVQERDIWDKAIIADDAPTIVGDTISPKQGKQLVFSYADDLESRALIADAEFTKDSALVGINGTNPARLDTFFRTKLTSTADIVSSDVEFDFNFNN
jgi:phage tail sheath gpL-like